MELNEQQQNDLYITEWFHLVHQLIDIHDAKDGERKECRQTFENLVLAADQQEYFAGMIKNRFSLSEDLFFFMMLGFLYEADVPLQQFTYRMTKENRLTFKVGFLLLQYLKELHYSSIFSLLDDQILKLIFLEDAKKEILLTKTMHVNAWIITFIDQSLLSSHPCIKIDLIQNERCLPIHQEVYQKLIKMIEQFQQFVLYAPMGSGKKTLLMRYAQEYQKAIQWFDMEMYLSCTFSEQQDGLKQAVFNTLLLDSLTVLIDQEDVTSQPQLFLSAYQLQCILCTQEHKDHQKYALTFDGLLSYEDMEKVIEYYDFDPSLLEYRYSIQELIMYSKNQLVCETHELGNSPYVTKVEMSVQKETYISDASNEEQIEMILFEMQNRKRIQRIIGNDKRGMQLLFYGPSGCGKTMLVSLLANQMQMPLYKIDLSMINDKYIGESEKHLAQIFSQAEKENALLLFDEADVLFAKRTSVENSGDRHANTVTAYLLQRMDHYDGIVFLTSNLITHFDTAFLRRFSYMLRFGKHNKAMQKRKWEVCLARLPYSHHLDLQAIVDAHDLTLAQISNVIKLTLVMLLKDQRELITARDLVKAIAMEENKGGEIRKERS